MIGIIQVRPGETELTAPLSWACLVCCPVPDLIVTEVADGP